jgi:hypothetical protein
MSGLRNDRTPLLSSHAGIDLTEPYARFNRARLVKVLSEIFVSCMKLLKTGRRLPSQVALSRVAAYVRSFKKQVGNSMR